jgi:hypothetical protein
VQHIAPLKYLDFHPENVEAALRKYPDRVAMYNSTHLATVPAGAAFVPRVAYAPRGTCGDDLSVLYNNFVHPIGAGDHKAKLESFYKGQSGSYDVYRHRFLHGRVPMIEAMPTPKNGVWVDLGGGTAANLQHLGPALKVFSKVVVLDLCRPLLVQAQKRVEANGWGDLVSCIEGDATSPKVKGLPKPGTVDVVTMSYSLTMIPDWRAALDNVSAAARMHCAPVAVRCSPPPPFLPYVPSPTRRRMACSSPAATLPCRTSPSRSSTASSRACCGPTSSRRTACTCPRTT